MPKNVVDDLAAPLGGLAVFAVAGAFVIVRGEIRPEVTAVALAAVVALAGRFGGYRAGVVSALMAAASFDFMHTKPYLSLKIDDSTDVVLTVMLLLVGLIVGGLAASASRSSSRLDRLRSAPSRIDRVLASVRTDTPEDIELAVRAELIGLLHLRDCWFTSDTVLLPIIGDRGQLDLKDHRYTHEGFELPRDGVAIEVAAFGRHRGYLVCLPTPGFGFEPDQRRVAAELGAILGMAMGADAAA